MPRPAVLFRGWTLQEAFDLEVDPILAEEKRIAVEKWNRSRKRITVSLMGQAVPNDVHLRDAAEAAGQRTVQGFQQKLASGALLAWGRRGSPTAEMRRLPASAWKSLIFTSWLRSEATERTPEKTKIFDIVIFPAALAPPNYMVFGALGPGESDGWQNSRAGRSNNPISTPLEESAIAQAEDACRDWLLGLMRESPRLRPKAKESYRTDAQKAWRGLVSGRAFNTLWTEAAEIAGTAAWVRPGRPKKSSHENQSTD